MSYSINHLRSSGSQLGRSRVRVATAVILFGLSTLHGSQVGEQMSDYELGQSILKHASDPDFVAKAAKKDLHLVTGEEYVIGSALGGSMETRSGYSKSKYVCEKFPFEKMICTTSQAIREVSKKYSGDQISAMIYANSTYFGGAFAHGCGTQEEHVCGIWTQSLYAI